MRGHGEVTATKAKVPATEMAAAHRAATEEAGSNMDRVDEIKKKIEGCDGGEDEE